MSRSEAWSKCFQKRMPRLACCPCVGHTAAPRDPHCTMGALTWDRGDLPSPDQVDSRRAAISHDEGPRQLVVLEVGRREAEAREDRDVVPGAIGRVGPGEAQGQAVFCRSDHDAVVNAPDEGQPQLAPTVPAIHDRAVLVMGLPFVPEGALGVRMAPIDHGVGVALEVALAVSVVVLCALCALCVKPSFPPKAVSPPNGSRSQCSPRLHGSRRCRKPDHRLCRAIRRPFPYDEAVRPQVGQRCERVEDGGY